MARNTTRQGANFELKIMEDLERFGYDSLRSSGSRGAVDVVAVGPAWAGGDGVGSLLFIQAKISKPVIPPDERIRLQNLALRAGAVPVVAYWAPDGITGLKRVHYRQLTGPGPKDWVPWVPREDE